MSKSKLKKANTSAATPGRRAMRPTVRSSPATVPTTPESTGSDLSRAESWAKDTTQENLGTSYQIIGVAIPRKP
jgi:hypothetical protein